MVVGGLTLGFIKVGRTKLITMYYGILNSLLLLAGRENEL